MTEQLDVQQMAQRLLAADNILILCHKNPDGDTIGCGSALYYALKALEKTTAVLCSDAIPSRYAFIKPTRYRSKFCLCYKANGLNLPDPATGGVFSARNLPVTPK